MNTQAILESKCVGDFMFDESRFHLQFSLSLPLDLLPSLKYPTRVILAAVPTEGKGFLQKYHASESIGQTESGSSLNADDTTVTE
jgi:hypothetical protein